LTRGRLRVYLGAAPGVGKTYAMLGEAHRRAERGTDVVIAFVEDHDRPLTRALCEGLETVPRRVDKYRGTTFTEMDLNAVLARRPKVALVDELAHTNIPGGRNAKRWQDIEELLAAGIDVISTVNIQHLESVNDVVEKITGVPQRETVPDDVVRAADQVELVDMSAEALRRRMAHGNVYAPGKVDAALANYFRVGNLTALRELALLWLADKVEEGLQQYRTAHDIDATWETRERVVVALTGGPEGETLLRRGGRVAARSSGGDLLAVHVTRSDGLTGASPAALAEQRRLVESLGGTYHQVIGDDIPLALLQFARAENATQLVMGTSRRSQIGSLFWGGRVGSAVIRGSGDIDVHMVTHEAAAHGGGLPRFGGGLSARRRAAGFLLGALLLPVLTVLGTTDAVSLNLVSDVLLFQLAVIVVALVGGIWPAATTAIVGSLLLNYYFVPPVHTFTINERNNALALAIFIVVAGAVSAVVDTAARRSRQAARSAAESETLATMAGSVLRGDAALPAILARIREAFAVAQVALLERTQGTGGQVEWSCVASSGEGPDPASHPIEGDTEEPIGERLVLVLRGRVLPAEDRRVLGALAAQAAAALEQQRMVDAAAAAKPLADANRTRTALLSAVGHDLRTPLTTAKAAVTSLRGNDITWTTHERDELLAHADASLDQLTQLVDDLLDLSRVQAGVLPVQTRAVPLDALVRDAVARVGSSNGRVVADVPSALPDALADPQLLQRVIVHLVTNAVRFSPHDQPVQVTGSALGDRLELRVVDRGPGIPEDERDQAFAPVQRLGDTDNNSGLGLGLALARGLTEAMGGTLQPEETPGGGLTMALSLPAAGTRLDP